MPALSSYIVQTVVSVELSYFANRWLTWRAAQAPFWSSLARYNVQKAVTVSANLVLYGVLLRLGVQYLLDNVLLTIVFTFVNYAGADKLVFLREGKRAAEAVPLPVPVVSGSLEPENH